MREKRNCGEMTGPSRLRSSSLNGRWKSKTPLQKRKETKAVLALTSMTPEAANSRTSEVPSSCFPARAVAAASTGAGRCLAPAHSLCPAPPPTWQTCGFTVPPRRSACAVRLPILPPSLRTKHTASPLHTLPHAASPPPIQRRIGASTQRGSHRPHPLRPVA